MVAVVRNDAEGHKDHEEGTRAVTRMTSLIVSIKPWDEDGLQGYFARRDAPGTIMSDSLDLAAQIRLLFHVLKLSYDSIYSKVAAVTFLACDICWTFPDEVQYIWRSKWTLAKVLYLIARYYALMYNLVLLFVDSRKGLSPTFCNGYHRFVTLAGSVVFTQVADIIFIQRVYALYHRNNKILFFLVPLLLVEATLNIYSATLAANISEGGLVTPPIPWPGCLVIIDSWLQVCLMAVIPTLTMAVVFFALTMYKFFGSIREQTGRRPIDVLRDYNNFSPILMILVWDGAVYFFLILIMLVIFAFFTLYKGGELGMSLVPWPTVVYSLAGSHLILNLRKAGGRGGPTLLMETLPSLQSDHDIRFVHKVGSIHRIGTLP